MPRSNSTSEPVGTPPEGGRWTWDGAEWVRQPEDETTAAANDPQPANQE